jgi:hypothetical protein
MATQRRAQHALQPLTRREAIAGALRAGGGLLAAGVTACGPGAIGAPSSPATSTPSPPSTSSPAPSGTPPAELRLSILPHSLVIPAVQLKVPVEPAAMIRNGQGRPEIVVPNHGIVGPNLNLGRNSANNVWILGHSRWAGVRQPLYRLGDVRAGDLVSIAGFERTRRQDLPAIEFRAERFLVADIESATAEIYQPRRSAPRLILQTSARQTGESAWILDRDSVEPRAEFRVRGDREDPSIYLVLLVIAALTPESLAWLRLPARARLPSPRQPRARAECTTCRPGTCPRTT